MQSIATALERLNEDVAWFARAQEIRLLVIRTSSDLRPTIVSLLPKYEFHFDNASPWVVLEDGRVALDDGWLMRAARLASHWQERQQLSKREGLELGDVAPPAIPPEMHEPDRPSFFGRLLKRKAAPPSEPSPARLEVFARTVSDVMSALSEPLEGLVLVLAPTQVDAPAVFEAELELLLGARELKGCRMVLVLDSGIPDGLVERLGDSASVSDCYVDPDELDADLRAFAASPATSSSAGAGAGPTGITPPPRIDDPPELPKEKRDEILREAGVEPEMVDEAPNLRALVLGAALAMKDGNGPEAIRLQREARDLAERVMEPALRVTCQIALASYLAGLDRRDLAEEELEGAARYCEAQELHGPRAQAYLALGLLQVVDKRQPDAARSYVLAGRVAERAEEPLLAIEAYRMAGQLAEGLGAMAQTITCYEEALRVAEAADAELVQNSSAAEVARQLAALKKKRSEAEEKAELTERASQMEQGLIGVGGGLRTEWSDEPDFDAPLPPLPKRLQPAEPIEPKLPAPEEPAQPQSFEDELHQVLTRQTMNLEALEFTERDRELAAEARPPAPPVAPVSPPSPPPPMAPPPMVSPLSVPPSAVALEDAALHRESPEQGGTPTHETQVYVSGTPRPEELAQTTVFDRTPSQPPVPPRPAAVVPNGAQEDVTTPAPAPQPVSSRRAGRHFDATMVLDDEIPLMRRPRRGQSTNPAGTDDGSSDPDDRGER